MPQPTPLKRDLPTHHRDGRIKFGVVLRMARKHRALSREVAACRFALPVSPSARAKRDLSTLRTRLEGEVAFWAVTNVPVFFYEPVERRVGLWAWTDYEITGRISAEEEAAAQAEALAAARVRDAAPMSEAA